MKLIKNINYIWKILNNINFFARIFKYCCINRCIFLFIACFLIRIVLNVINKYLEDIYIPVLF